MFITSKFNEGEVWIDTSEIFCFYIENGHINTDDNPNTPCFYITAVLKILPQQNLYEISGTEEAVIVREDNMFHFIIDVALSYKEAQTKLKLLLHQIKDEEESYGY